MLCGRRESGNHWFLQPPVLFGASVCVWVGEEELPRTFLVAPTDSCHFAFVLADSSGLHGADGERLAALFSCFSTEPPLSCKVRAYCVLSLLFSFTEI